MPRSVLWVLLVALVISFVGLAFLIGRATCRCEVPELAVAAPVATPPEESELSQAEAPETVTEVEPDANSWDQAFGPTPEPASGPEVGADVARYFEELEAIEADSRFSGDPQQLAMELLGQLSGGETSGLRDLVSEVDRGRLRMTALDVPAPCAEHHRRALALTNAGLRLLSGIERGAAGGDVSGLVSLASEARGLEAQARELQALEKRIKQKYGITLQ